MYCKRLTVDESVDVKNRMCRTKGGNKRPSFGMADTKTAVYCKPECAEPKAEIKFRSSEWHAQNQQSAVRITPLTGSSTSAVDKAVPKAMQATVVRINGYEKGAVLHTACPKKIDRRKKMQKMQSQKIWQDSVFRCGR